MAEYSTYSLANLIEVITTWRVGMPVRAMERVTPVDYKRGKRLLASRPWPRTSRGPIALGWSSDFGLGLFVAEEERE